MKRIVLLLFAIAIAILGKSQKAILKELTVRKCGTMIAIEKSKKEHPEYYAELDKKAKEYEKSGSVAKTSTLTSTVTIPVVVHVVHSTPDLVTEDQVDYLLSRLNLDYSGLNSDSANATAFYSVRGHSLIRFTRARRDPSGNITNGIEKRVSTTGILATTYQPVKHSSAGGLDPWDVTKYYNIWVAADASGQGLLGIAPCIGPGAATETSGSAVGIDGVCIEIGGFSNGCYSYTAFNMARTAVHEIGHNFGLYHTFTACTTGADFDQLDSGQLLPTNLLAASDDTPNQGTETSGCPSGTSASDCSGVNKMYQNYMDYSNDACLTMFTKGQVDRMHYVLENFRSGYLTTNGATPPASYPSLDVSANAIISPGGIEFNNSTCTITSYPTPSCAGAFTPKLQIKNLGSTTLTSITVGITVNGVTSNQTFTGLNVVTFGTAVLTFSSKTVVVGSNTISYTVSAPNGGTDEVSANNTVSQTFTITAGSSAPISEGFEGTTFPPSGWSLVASAGGSNWARSTAAHKTGAASMKADFFNITDGQEFSLLSVPISMPYNSTGTLTFDYSFRMYNAASVYDTLEILASNDCGSTWSSLWKKGGTQLSTVSTTSTSAFTPTSTQWATTSASVSLTSYLNQSVQLKFRARSGYGNNLYVDNISVSGTNYLPLNFISFSGYVTAEKNIQLNWKTANEIGCDYFDIEKSVDGISFEKINKVIAINGTLNQYGLVDPKPWEGSNYYRLKQVDKDGKVTYSNIILINVTKASANSFTMYPNPVKDKLTINVNAICSENGFLKIMDVQGRLISQREIKLQRGSQSFTLNTANLLNGIYSISLTFGSETITQKLIK